MTHKSSVCISGTCLLEDGERRLLVHCTRQLEYKERIIFLSTFVPSGSACMRAHSNAAGWSGYYMQIELLCKWIHEEE